MALCVRRTEPGGRGESQTFLLKAVKLTLFRYGWFAGIRAEGLGPIDARVDIASQQFCWFEGGKRFLLSVKRPFPLREQPKGVPMRALET